MMTRELSKSRLIAASMLAIYVYGSVALLLGTVLPALAKQFSLDNEQASWLPLANAAGLVLASIMVGPVVDRRGKKTALVGGLALIVAALLGLAAAPSYALALAALLVLGYGGGMIVTGANALVSDLESGRRASILNLLNLFFGLGGMTTPFVAANILQIQSAASICYFLAALTGIALLVHISTRMPSPAGAAASVGAGFGHIFSKPVFYLLAFQLFLYTGIEVGTETWLVKYLIGDPARLSERVATNILSLGFAMGLLVGRLASARLFLGVADWKVTLGSGITMAVTTYAMLQATSQMAVMALVFLAGLACAPMFPTVLAMVGYAFTENAAQALGTAITIGWFGFLVLPPLMGKIGGGDLSKGLLLIPVCGLGVALLNLGLRTVHGASRASTLEVQ